MKILLIHNYYKYWGGEEKYFTSLKELLEKAGHKVIIYSKHSKNIVSFWDLINTIVGLFYNRQTARELSSIIKREKPDIAHFNNIYPSIGAISYLICNKYKIPIVQTIHNYRFMCVKGILFKENKVCEACINTAFPLPAMISKCYHNSYIASFFFTLAHFFYLRILKIDKIIDRYIFPSKFTQKYYEKNLKIPLLKSKFLPYFIQPQIKNPKNHFNGYDFVYIGRLSEEKGIVELLSQIMKMPNRTLAVIGDGPLAEELKSYNKYSNIHFLGFKNYEQIKKIVSGCYAVIIPSLWYEVLPYVLLENVFGNNRVITFKNLALHRLLNSKVSSNQILINNIPDLYSKLKKGWNSFVPNIPIPSILKDSHHISALENIYLQLINDKKIT